MTKAPFVSLLMRSVIVLTMVHELMIAAEVKTTSTQRMPQPDILRDNNNRLLADSCKLCASNIAFCLLMVSWLVSLSSISCESTASGRGFSLFSTMLEKSFPIDS